MKSILAIAVVAALTCPALAQSTDDLLLDAAKAFPKPHAAHVWRQA